MPTPELNMRIIAKRKFRNRKLREILITEGEAGNGGPELGVEITFSNGEIYYLFVRHNGPPRLQAFGFGSEGTTHVNA